MKKIKRGERCVNNLLLEFNLNFSLSIARIKLHKINIEIQILRGKLIGEPNKHLKLKQRKLQSYSNFEGPINLDENNIL